VLNNWYIQYILHCWQKNVLQCKGNSIRHYLFLSVFTCGVMHTLNFKKHSHLCIIPHRNYYRIPRRRWVTDLIAQRDEATSFQFCHIFPLNVPTMHWSAEVLFSWPYYWLSIKAIILYHLNIISNLYHHYFGMPLEVSCLPKEGILICDRRQLFVQVLQ
jgi:hypothetical protein